jgi:methionine-rich copper-binding protein CopC
MRSFVRPYRSLLVPIVALSLALPAARSEAARLPHLRLVRSSPAADTVLATSPDAVRLWLSEPAEVPGTRIDVSSDAGVAAKVGKPTRANTANAPLEAKFEAPLAAGHYVVKWKTMSKDGHVVNGTFGFTVKPAK